MPDAATAKVCTICGLDCSTKRRAKDQQGRYTCGNCLDRAKQAALAKQGKPLVTQGPLARATADVAKVAAGDDGSDLILAGLVSKSTMLDTKACTECGFPMKADAILCTHCGHNTVTGKALRTRILKPEKVKEERASRRASISFGPAAVFFIFFALSAGLMIPGLMLKVPELFFVGAGLGAIFTLWVGVSLLFSAFRASLMQGLAIIACYFIPFGFLYTLYYLFAAQDDENLKAGYCANVLSWFVVGIAFLMNAIPASPI